MGWAYAGILKVIEFIYLGGQVRLGKWETRGGERYSKVRAGANTCMGRGGKRYFDFWEPNFCTPAGFAYIGKARAVAFAKHREIYGAGRGR